MNAPAYLAIDWGTTNRRVYALGPDGRVLSTFRDGKGALAMRGCDYAAELAALRGSAGGGLMAIAAGMVGSSIGWRDTGYVSAPAGFAEIAAAVTHLEEERILLLPGLAIDEPGRCDVMRGEEVQVLGAAAAGLVPADAVVCQPGTHNKWAWLEGGRIARFETAMTGEMFALLRDHSILAQTMSGPARDGEAFRAGVLEGAGRRDLLTALFSVRSSVLLGRRPAAHGTAYASGMLIGADVGGRVQDAGGCIHLLADAALGGLYAAAIETLGGRAVIVDSQAAFAAGVHRIWSLA